MKIIKENKRLGIIYGVEHGELFLTVAGRTTVAADTSGNREEMNEMYENAVEHYTVM